MKSDSQGRPSAGAWNWRFTWSSGQGEALSLIVCAPARPDNSLRAKLARQPRHGAAGDLEAFPAHLPLDRAHAVDGEVLGEDAGDLGLRSLAEPKGGTLSRLFLSNGQARSRGVASA